MDYEFSVPEAAYAGCVGPVEFTIPPLLNGPAGTVGGFHSSPGKTADGAFLSAIGEAGFVVSSSSCAQLRCELRSRRSLMPRGPRASPPGGFSVPSDRLRSRPLTCPRLGSEESLSTRGGLGPAEVQRPPRSAH